MGMEICDTQNISLFRLSVPMDRENNNIQIGDMAERARKMEMATLQKLEDDSLKVLKRISSSRLEGVEIQYSYGPDGKRYIVNVVESQSNSSSEDSSDAYRWDDDPQIRRLKAVEEDVREHELTHLKMAGPYAGAVKYRYQTGPDGKQYIAGGHVSISIPSGRSSEDTVNVLTSLKMAALGPEDPSPHDRQVASALEAKIVVARQEIDKTKRDEIGQMEEKQKETLQKKLDAFIKEGFAKTSDAKTGTVITIGSNED